MTPIPEPSTEPTAMAGRVTDDLPAVASITPWLDPVVDRRGHDPRSRYVELFWLGTLGPTATWLLRRLVSGFDHAPDGYDLDLAATARSLGLSVARGTGSPFWRAVHRCVMFGMARPTAGGLAVRRRVPQAPQRHLARLPAETQALHAEWQRTTIRLDGLERAHHLATAMLAAGDDAGVVEPQLVAIGVEPPAAAEASRVAIGGSAPPPAA